MSLFTLKEWWGVSVGNSAGGEGGQEEEFDVGSMVVGNIDNATKASDKIAVASLSGNLRIYHPTQRSYGVTDLIYEDNLGDPILQLLLGHFIPTSASTISLAVLHPRCVIIVVVVVVVVVVAHVSTVVPTSL